MDYIYIANIVKCSVVDGVGLRDAIYCSYCTHGCRGCHNKRYWALESGTKMNVNEIYNNLNPICNVSYVGGEPMLQADGYISLSKLIKQNTNKTIWIWSGFTYEEILANEKMKELLSYCDVLIDGKFEIDKFDRNKKWAGSTNQRCIKVKESLELNKVILYED